MLTRLVVLAVAALQGYGIAAGLEAANAFEADASAAIPSIILTVEFQQALTHFSTPSRPA